MTRAAIALGSNMGDRLAYLRYGAESLAELGAVVSVSSIYETAPVGGPEQDAFFNAVIVIDTDLDAITWPELAFQNLIRQRILNLLLNRPL